MCVRVLGEGEPLLMIHGIISDSSFFEGAAERLCERFRVISYDRRGYGRSEAPGDGDFSVAAQAEDAARVLDEWAGEPAWVFGNSAGGLVATELALRYPHLVRGMVLLEPSLVVDEETAAEIAAWNAELNGYLEQGSIKRALPAFARVVGEPAGSGPRQSLAQMRQVFANLENFMHGELNCVQRNHPSVEVLRSLGVPVRVMVTKEGRQGMFGRTSERGAQVLGWPVDFVEGYHNTARDNPVAFAESLGASIAALRG